MVLRSHWLPDKSEVVAERGMVVAKHPLAADAGIEILAEGGTAIDAAVATGFALTVVKPMMTGIGGIGFLLAHDAATDAQWCFDGAPRAPLAAAPDCYAVEGANSDGIGLFRVRGDENFSGHRSVAVPGVVAVLCAAHARFGSLPLMRVLEPAIRLAAEGFPADWATVAHTANAMGLLRRNRAAAAVFLPNDQPPGWGPPATILRQTDLAQTLRQIARQGADGFYRGEVAEAVAHDMAEHGGWITREDLARYPCRVDPPLRARYRDVEVLTAPMPCGGTTMLQTLRLLERFDVAAAGHNTPRALHLFAEAARRAFADRFHYLGDPEFVRVPLAGLLSDGHIDQLAALIDERETGFASGPDDPEPWVRYAAQPPTGDPWRHEGAGRPAALVGAHPGGDDDTCTTHFSVVDARRNAVSCTITAAGMFGSGVMSPTTGILWNNGMTWFNPLPGAANSIAPGKRALTNMTPALVLRDGRPFVAVGAPGGRKIINAIAQVISNVVDHRMTLQQAITAPRIDASANETLADVRIDPATVAGLESLGHRVRVVEDTPVQANFARPLGVLIDPTDATLRSGLDAIHMAEARGL